MATEQPGLLMSFEASGDLSSDQFKFVDLASDGQMQVVSTQGDPAIGVLQDKPSTTGEAGQVMKDGITKVSAGGSISVNDEIAADGSGKAITATTSGDKIMGMAIDSASSGDIFSMILEPSGEVA